MLPERDGGHRDATAVASTKTVHPRKALGAHTVAAGADKTVKPRTDARHEAGLSYLEHFQARVIQDALNEATAEYWKRRAAAFEAVGTPTATEIAQACRNHATLLEGAPHHG